MYGKEYFMHLNCLCISVDSSINISNKCTHTGILALFIGQ